MIAENLARNYDERGRYYESETLEVPEADFRIPSRVLNDEVLFAGVGQSSQELISATGEWIADTVTRGKLLPFTYDKLTVGVSGDSTPYLLVGSGDNSQLQSFADASTPYASGDTFSVKNLRGDDSSLTVTQVDGNGTPTEFLVTNTGKDFIPTSFNGGINLTEESVTGKGFVGRVNFGRVCLFEDTIAKPAELTTSAQRLTPTSTDGALVKNLSQDTSVFIDSEKVSSDNRYDIFLFCHNDISHVIGATSDYSEPFTVSKQQKIDLTIQTS